MGEIADWMIDRALARHMNVGQSFQRSSINKRFRERFATASDEELLSSTEKALETGLYNERFEKISRNIVAGKPTHLSERQRNSLLGLLGMDWNEYKEKVNELSDDKLLLAGKYMLERGEGNDSFVEVATKILAQSPTSLSVKQRNAVMGFLC